MTHLVCDIRQMKTLRVEKDSFLATMTLLPSIYVPGLILIVAKSTAIRNLFRTDDLYKRQRNTAHPRI